MSEQQSCPKCGEPLPPHAPAGICPKCLLKAGFPSEPAAAGFTPPDPAELAAHFPDLEIRELLGKGGMGAVYKAQQQRLDRVVAVKILPTEISDDPAFAERFTREARTLAKLNHPNIVQVHDFGQAGQYFYFVMEYVDGLNLRQMIEAGRLESTEALSIVPDICAALQFAHDVGIVHRDIKPENILIDQHGRVKIADFGLAMLLDREPADVTLTGANQVMGTPHYMAPEQMRGSHTIDHRADIYSLGVVFYELLTGELPIGRFEAPSEKLQVDVRLDQVVLRTLASDPDRRYQHASDVQHDVQQISGAVPLTSSNSGEMSPGPAHGSQVGSSVRLLLMIVGNLWLLAAVALLLGKKVARTRPTMYSFFDIGAWLYPSTYNMIVAFCGLLSVGFFVFAWRGRPGHAVRPRRKQLPSDPSLQPTAQFSAENAEGHPSSAVPRFSRQALLGGSWAPFFFITLLLSMTHYTSVEQGPVATEMRQQSVSRVAEATSVESESASVPVQIDASTATAEGQTWWQWLLILTVLPLGLTAPFGTTILGLAAISSIRHSRGQLSGLPLAVADALFFPLLILDIIVGVAVIYSISAIFDHGIYMGLAFALFLIPALIMDFFIARAVWRRASAGM
jgi:serine/threonine protein kinase